MKFKLSAEPKDWAMFAIYAVILLYFVAIAELNLAQLAAGDVDHLFHGFNPFPAFAPPFLGYTIIFYIIALVASMFIVPDRFFDTEKGFGISFEKKRKDGYSKWLDASTLKKQKDIEKVDVQAEMSDAGGIPLINDGKHMWVDNGEGHNLIIGSTGSGKTQMMIFPLVKTLAKHGESMIITDPKGEVYEGTSEMLKKLGYNVVLLNFRDPQQGSGWNPLHLPYYYYKNGNKDKANELIDDLAVNILYDQNAQQQDPFWEKTSADYFSGLCLALFEDAKDESVINLNSINMFTTVGEEKSAPNSTYVKDYFSFKDPSSPAYVSASSTLIAPEETKGSILSVFKQKLRLFASRENISEMLSHSDFEMNDIGSKKTAVFIVIQDEKTTYHPLVTIFIKQCYETLVDYAQRHGGKLPYRTNFLMDEFANMPPLKDVGTMVSAARSRRMRFYFVIQNFAQLNKVYGKDVGDTIRGNCTNWIYLISTELEALKEISEMCGEVKVKSGKGDKEKEETRPLITVSDLQKLELGQVILIRTRLDPFRTKLKFDYQMDWGPLFKNSDHCTYPEREKKPIQVFDLKGFVKEKKKERMDAMLSGGTSRAKPSPSFTPFSSFSAPKNQSSDIDDLIKRIDSKIAELEEEDEKDSKDNKFKVNPIIEDEPKVSHKSDDSIGEIPKSLLDAFNIPSKEEVKLPEEVKPKKEIKEEPEIKKNDQKIELKDSKKPKEDKINISEKTPKIEVSEETKERHNIDTKKLAERISKKVNNELSKKEKDVVFDEDFQYDPNTTTDDEFFDDFFSDDDY